jgi:hypothetical protein
MLRKLVIGGIIAAATLVGSAGTGHAGLSVDLGIHLGTPPIFEPVPASPVQYAPAVGINLFSYAGEFFVFSNGGWYVGAGHNGPWTQLPPQYVPRPILAVPVRFYHERPREWAHWRHEAPPRWAPSWGNRWEERYAERRRPSYHDEHRSVRPAAYRDDYRDERHVAYRDDHRDDRRGDRHDGYRDERR